MNSSDDSGRLPALVRYTKLLDQARNTDFCRTFPELAPYWAACDGGEKPA
jgi:hypothetical protein